MRVLVTGGAGYIGSITVKLLQKEGIDVVVFDNLIYGHKEAVSAPLVVGDLTDKDFLFNSLKDYDFDGVIHFAAYALAGESMEKPHKYFLGNTVGGLNLLEYMVSKNINSIIFSSTCAIYGSPKQLPVTEEHVKHPESVYGESKLMFEKILDWYGKIYGIKYMNLRYFNAAGAALDGSLGESHDPETHIIPIAIKCAMGDRPFPVFGNDYETKDGTCIRDYVHVEDLASAHKLALEKLMKTGQSDELNLGSGMGYSNLEVIEAIERASGKKLSLEFKPRRTGDPAVIYANINKAKNLIGFDPRNSDLNTIVKTAWDWHTSKVDSSWQ